MFTAKTTMLILVHKTFRLTQRAGKARARVCKTDLGSQDSGKAKVHRHHPCSAPERKQIINETTVIVFFKFFTFLL